VIARKVFTGAAYAAGAALVLLAQILPASADDASVLQTKIRAALRTAKSFVETVTIKGSPGHPLGGAATLTVVAPNRFRQFVNGGPGDSDDTIIIGDDVYGNEGKGWDVLNWTDRLVTDFEGDVFAVRVSSVGPDRTVDGKTVGSFAMIDPHGATDNDILQCTYEKSSFRPLACTGIMSTIKYASYDNPTLAIEAPKNARRTDK
jgi:hypothetical protein